MGTNSGRCPKLCVPETCGIGMTISRGQDAVIDADPKSRRASEDEDIELT